MNGKAWPNKLIGIHALFHQPRQLLFSSLDIIHMLYVRSIQHLTVMRYMWASGNMQNGC